MASLNIEFVAARVFEGKTSDEKIRLVLDSVKKGKILVLESGFTVVEERDLIKATMPLINKGFPGIEVSTLSQPTPDLKSLLIKALGGSQGLTIVGPSNLVKKITKDPTKLNVVAGK